MATYTDFKNGLQSANDYLDARHHISGTEALGNDALNVVVQAEYSFTLRELLCGMLSGNGLKLPNLQICLHANIQALLGLPNLQAELYDALSQLDGAFQEFMDHTKLDNVLGRLNGVLAEAQNVANMINFCSAPVDPIAIPNMLERAMGSFLGAGKNIVDSIGDIAPDGVCACLGTGGFNTNAFQGGILGNIANNINAVTSGQLADDIIAGIRNDINGVVDGIKNLISFENNISGSYGLGGSQFATPDSGCNSGIGVMHNPFSGSMADNARLTTSLKALYDKLSGYPVTYRGGTYLGGTKGGEPLSPVNGEVIEYPNIFHVLLDPEFLELIANSDDPQSTVDTQVPVFDYCGNVIGYTTNYVQQEQQTSDGTTPTVPNSPGYAAGGLQTSNSTTENTNTIQNSDSTVTFSGGGANVFLVNSEAAQLALTPNTHDIVVRTDILTVFVRKDTSSFSSGTMSDYQQSSVTFTAFGKNVNELSGQGFVTKDGAVAVARTIQGTANEITVINGNGAGGNPTIGLADNTVIPGVGAIKVPVGSTSQRPSPEAGKLRYNTNTNTLEAFFNDTGIWEELATANDLIQQQVLNVNIGNGAEVFKQRNIANEQEFRKINNSGLVTVTQNADDITVGDDMTITNVGTGTGTFKQRSTNNFQFKSLTTATSGNITITNNADTIDISGDPRVKYAELQTTTNTTTVVNFEGAIQQPASGKTWMFTVTALAGDTGTTRRGWKLEGIVQNNSGTPSIIGSVSRTDYQRSTSDFGLPVWQGTTSYSPGDVVEYDLVEYTANNAVQSFTSPDQDSVNWTATYVGWNVSADVIGGDFSVRVRGDTNTVNWSVKLSFIEL